MRSLILGVCLLMSVSACSISEDLDKVMGRSPAAPTTTTQSEPPPRIDCDLIFPGTDYR